MILETKVVLVSLQRQLLPGFGSFVPKSHGIPPVIPAKAGIQVLHALR
jgi:hypothetical protein